MHATNTGTNHVASSGMDRLHTLVSEASCDPLEVAANGRRPEVRDVFITNPDILTAGDPLKALSACTSVNWQWSTAEAICSPYPGAKDLRISPQFERYVEDINNWSLSPECLASFPQLADKAWIRRDDGEDEEIGRPDEK